MAKTHGPRVLVVDDDADMREIAAELLGLFGYAVDTAADGAQALAAIRRRRPDAMLTDLRMPVMDGAHLVEACRADPTIATLPVCLMTGTPPSDPDRLDVQALLTKPFEAEDLLDVARRLTAPLGPPPSGGFGR